MRGVSASLVECAREGLCVLAASLVFAVTCCAWGLCSVAGQESHGHSAVTAHFLLYSCSV